MENEQAQKIINIKYAYALYYDRLATLGYAVNALGLKRILMQLSKQYMKDYLSIKNKILKELSIVLYPDMSFVNNVLSTIPKTTYDPLNVNSKEFLDTLQYLMKSVKKCEKENIETINKEIISIEHSHPKMYRKIMLGTTSGECWIGKINKMEMMYDRFEWNPAFISQDQKRIHDLIKKEKY